jgi:rare lipoprotein A
MRTITLINYILFLSFFALSATLAAEAASWTEEGIASWYGAEFQGRPTSSGEIFNPANLTAAHKSLPFGTMVRVSNPTNGQAVVVRINDRGPFVAGRIIDLSQAAAQKLGIGSAGTLMVRLSLEGSSATLAPAVAAPASPTTAPIVQTAGPAVTAPIASNPWRTIQIASFSSTANARGLIDSLALQGVAANIETAVNQGVFRVVIANVEIGAVDALVEKLRGLGYPKVLVRQK